MAEREFDIAQLTEDQQLALQQFTSVTDQELSAAVPLLQKCEWNVQIAIARFFDGDPPEPPPEPDIPPPPQAARRHETLANGFSSELRRRTQHNLEPAPRVVPQPPSQINQQPPFLISLLLAPVNVVYGLFSRVFGVFAYLFPFLPRLLARLRTRPSAPPSQRNAGGRRPLGPQDTTRRFLRELETDYGQHSLPLLETGYSRAFDLAKHDLKFLLVIPISPEHEDTPTFIRNTLLSPTVTSFLNNPEHNLFVWAGSVQDAEPYQVATALNMTRFPCAALIAHTPSVSATAMSVVLRISGPVTPESFTAQLHAAIQQHTGALDRTRSARAEQAASRTLREQQNSAYERSLAQDRERARQKREAEEEQSKAEKAELNRLQAEERRAQDLDQWKRWRASKLPQEPAADVKDAVRLSIRLLDGERVMRKFSPDAQMEEVYAFVECYDVLNELLSEKEKLEEAKPEGFEHEYEFRLVTPMPREVYELKNGGTIRQRIGRSGNLMVERIEEDEGSSTDEE